MRIKSENDNNHEFPFVRPNMDSVASPANCEYIERNGFNQVSNVGMKRFHISANDDRLETVQITYQNCVTTY